MFMMRVEITGKSISFRLENSSALFCYREGYFNYPVSPETFVELAHALQASALERLTIYDINNEGLKVLAQSLPKTLIYFDLGENNLSEEIIPILNQMMQLKELILNDQLATQYLQQQEPSSLSTVKAMRSNSWEAKLSRKNRSLNLDMNEVDDTVWPLLIAELTKDDTTFREIDLSLGPNHLNHLEPLFGKQCRLTSLTITNSSPDISTAIELFRVLKENNSIRKLEVSNMDRKIL